ncbi:MAG: 2-amino-4-hydroxy-6-hydroxymethyldihydropteridine diphosphokinase [Cyclobacteriaceae bacterium]|nr:2-amino-4-hydroxy-6-hydroxymethyldihydropteridine diphosphokinase [Cyclobacteriaceae bacterium]
MIEGIYLLLGSNLGDKLSYLSQAIEKIEKTIGRVKNVSSVYETAAWGKEDQPTFYNQVIEIKSSLGYIEILKGILAIEQEIGRKRKEKWGARIIDIDLLYFGTEIFTNHELVLPHPEIQNRRFTLIPLCEIAQNFIHPVLKVTHQQLLEQCNDSLEVKKLNTSNL